MSGAAIRLSTRERAGKLAEAVLMHLGLTRAQLGELQTMPFKQLIAAIGPARKMVGAASQPLFDRYDFGPVVDGKTLPAHPFDPAATDVSADIPVLVGNVKDEMAIYNTIDAVGATDRGPVAHDLSRRMSATWAAFARSGKPDNPAIPQWPAYTLAGRSTMIFNRECSVASDYGGEARLLWKKIAAV